MIRGLGLYAATVTVMLITLAIQWNAVSDELAVTNERLKEQTFLASSFQAEVVMQADRYTVLTHKRAELQRLVREQQVKIGSYIGREDVVYAKPGLVERLEKRAMDKFFKEIESDDN